MGIAFIITTIAFIIFSVCREFKISRIETSLEYWKKEEMKERLRADKLGNLFSDQVTVNNKLGKELDDMAMAIKSKPPTRPDPGLVNHVIVCDIGEDDADVRCYNERGDRLPMRLTPGPELNMANSLLRSLQGWQSHFQRTRNAQGSQSREGAEGQPRARDQKG